MVNTKKGDSFAPGGMRRIGRACLEKNAQTPKFQGQKLPEPAHECQPNWMSPVPEDQFHTIADRITGLRSARPNRHGYWISTAKSIFTWALLVLVCTRVLWRVPHLLRRRGSGTYPKMFSDHALDPEYEPLQDRDHRRPSSIHLPHILAPPEPAFTMKNRR